MGFENIPKKIKEGVKSTTKIGLLGLGLLGTSCEDKNCAPDVIKINKGPKDKEISQAEFIKNRKNPSPDDYDLSTNAKKLDLSDLELKKSLDSKFIEKSMLLSLSKEKLNNEEAISSEILQEIEDLRNVNKEIPEEIKIKLTKQQEKINKIKETIDKEDLVKIKNELSETDKKYLELAPKLFELVESARKEVARLIDNKDYIHRLELEYKCSKKEAYHHQQVRLSNLNLANYYIVGPKEIIRMGGSTNIGFFLYHSNKITLSYNSDLKTFYYTALHELMHLITNGKHGMSNMATYLLSKSSFHYRSDYKDKTNEYMSSPTERYVRLKILEEELDKRGIKKIGEKFTLEQYKQLYNLYMKGELEPDSQNFIEFTKTKLDTKNHFKLIKKLFDEIADLYDSQKPNGEETDYKHPDWNYENPTT